ncbi:MAG: sialidase family protein, partial [Kofleriaceae bacterium]|nr:sialidase family protein [Kofleriaceae bacterium]
MPRTCPGTSTRDAAFGPAEQLTTASTAGAYQVDPAAVLTSDGSVFVVAAAPDTEGTQLVDTSTRSRTDKLFVETQALAPHVSLARDRKGVLYAVWLDTRRGPQVLFVRSRDDGTTWSVPAAVNDSADCAAGEPCLEQAFVVASDTVYVGYVAGGAVRVRTSFDEGASFRAPVTVLSAIRASATIDAKRRLHVIGVQGGPVTGAYGSASHAITYVTSSDGGRTFTRPAVLSKRDERLPFYGAVPQLVVDDKRGWMYAVYIRGGRDAVWDLAMLASKDNGKTWKRARIGDDCAIHMSPKAALDPTTGTLHLAWYDSRGAAGRLAHATCTPGLAKCTVPLAISDRPFAGLSTARRAASAVGDSVGLAVDDKRR